jgi:hypothetical protein
MAEYTRISLRTAIEQATAAQTAASRAYERLAAIGASESTTALASAVVQLGDAIINLQLVDDHIQKKAGLLPGTTSGEPPAK